VLKAAEARGGDTRGLTQALNKFLRLLDDPELVWRNGTTDSQFRTNCFVKAMGEVEGETAKLVDAIGGNDVVLNHVADTAVHQLLLENLNIKYPWLFKEGQWIGEDSKTGLPLDPTRLINPNLAGQIQAQFDVQKPGSDPRNFLYRQIQELLKIGDATYNRANGKPESPADPTAPGIPGVPGGKGESAGAGYPGVVNSASGGNAYGGSVYLPASSFDSNAPTEPPGFDSETVKILATGLIEANQAAERANERVINLASQMLLLISNRDPDSAYGSRSPSPIVGMVSNKDAEQMDLKETGMQTDQLAPSLSSVVFGRDVMTAALEHDGNGSGAYEYDPDVREGDMQAHVVEGGAAGRLRLGGGAWGANDDHRSRSWSSAAASLQGTAPAPTLASSGSDARVRVGLEVGAPFTRTGSATELRQTFRTDLELDVGDQIPYPDRPPAWSFLTGKTSAADSAPGLDRPANTAVPTRAHLLASWLFGTKPEDEAAAALARQKSGDSGISVSNDSRPNGDRAGEVGGHSPDVGSEDFAGTLRQMSLRLKKNGGDTEQRGKPFKVNDSEAVDRLKAARLNLNKVDPNDVRQPWWEGMSWEQWDSRKHFDEKDFDRVNKVHVWNRNKQVETTWGVGHDLFNKRAAPEHKHVSKLMDHEKLNGHKPVEFAQKIYTKYNVVKADKAGADPVSS